MIGHEPVSSGIVKVFNQEMESKQRYILLTELPGVTRGPGGGERHVVVLPGTLMHRLESSNYQVCSLYDLVSNHSTTLKVREDMGDVLSLSKYEAQLLSAIPSPVDRFTVYTTPGKLDWGASLKIGDIVYTHLRDIHCVAVAVRYQGPLEGYGPDKIMFGVEIQNRKYRGWGDNDGTNKRSTKKEEKLFKCDKKCGLFLSLDQLQEKPDKKPTKPSQDEAVENAEAPADKERNTNHVPEQVQTPTNNEVSGTRADVTKQISQRRSGSYSLDEQEEKQEYAAAKYDGEEQIQARVEEDEHEALNQQVDEFEDVQNQQVDGNKPQAVPSQEQSDKGNAISMQGDLYMDTGHYSPNPVAVVETHATMDHAATSLGDSIALPDVTKRDGATSTQAKQHGAFKLHVPRPVDEGTQQHISEERERAQAATLDHQISKLTQANKRLEYDLSLQHYHDQENEAVIKFQQQLQQQKEELDQIKARMQSKEEKEFEWWEVSLSDREMNSIRILERESWGYIGKGKFRGQKVSIKSLNQDIVSLCAPDHIRQLMGKMAKIQHSNIVPFLGAVLSSESTTGSLLIITELADTTLHVAIRDKILEEKCKLPILSDIASALCFLHSQRQPIIHGAVTSKNVLLEGKRNNAWKAKLSDFASANLLTIGPAAVKHATPYTAPEILHGEEKTPKLDVYSLGVVICETALCQSPLEPEEIPSMLEKVKANQSQEIFDIAQDCTKQNSNDRPCMSTVLDKIDLLIEEDSDSD